MLKFRKVKLKTLMLFILYAQVFLALLTSLAFLSPLTVAAFAFLYCLLFYLDLSDKHPVSRNVLTAVGILLTIFFLSKVSLDNVVHPITYALMSILTIKLFEDKKQRDIFEIMLLVLFLFSASALFTVSIAFLIAFITFILLSVSEMIIMTFWATSPKAELTLENLRSVALISVVIPVLSIPLSIFFFFILPRSKFPLFRFPTGAAQTGFSQQIKLGQIAQLQSSKKIVMRIKMPYIGQIYIRGIVFDEPMKDGWIFEPVEEKIFLPKLKGIRQEVILEPYYGRNLFALDVPKTIHGIKAIKLPQAVFIARKLLSGRRLKYQALSIPVDSYKASIDFDFYTQLPKLSKKVLNFCKSFDDVPKQKLIFSLIKKFKAFRYSTKNLPKTLDEFIGRKRGDCEYFSSLSAIVLRYRKIPARLVGGYISDTYNNLGGYYDVSSKDSHVWVEYYMDGRWHRFDPTPSNMLKNYGGMSAVRELFDYINYIWLNMFINFNFSKQVKLMGSVKTYAFSFKLHIRKHIRQIVLIILLAIVMYLLLINIIKDDYDRVVDMLRKMGYKKPKHIPLYSFIKEIDDEYVKKLVMEFLKIYEPHALGLRKLSRDERKRLKEILRELRNYSKSKM